MSALRLQLVTVLWFSCTALSDPGSRGVVWRKAGEAVTIRCSCPVTAVDSLYLNKGLNEELEVLYKQPVSVNVNDAFRDRLQVKGTFPNVSISIQNLTSEDTGPYWCVFKTFNSLYGKADRTKGRGSVLLVVTESVGSVRWIEKCETKQNMVLVIVVISAVVLLSFIMCAFIWIVFKAKLLRNTVKPKRVVTNDVYEDMRSTLKR